MSGTGFLDNITRKFSLQQNNITNTSALEITDSVLQRKGISLHRNGSAFVNVIYMQESEIEYPMGRTFI
jgi:hypothetical protein